MYRDHLFTDELLAPDGNFYPPHSKLRPAVSFKKGAVYLEGPKARIYELEKRRVVEILTPTEEEELQDLTAASENCRGGQPDEPRLRLLV
jgi:hypothetical protein